MSLGLSIVHCRSSSIRDPLLTEYAEAQLVVRVTVSEVFRNCPRYVHRYKRVEVSEFVPHSARETAPCAMEAR